MFYSATLNDPAARPLIRGACGPVQCQAESEFINVQVGPDGTPWAAAVDGCPQGSCVAAGGQLMIGRLVGGPSLGTDFYK